MDTNLDLDLFHQIKTQDDRGAYESLFKKYYKELYYFGCHFLHNQDAAEEITQEVFLYIWEKRKKIEIRTGLKTYLYSAVRNKCLNYIKIEKPRRNQLDDSHLNLVVTSQSEFDETLNNHAIKKNIKIAIDTLPPKCKEIFTLSRYGGMTYDEIAEELDISVKTVENQIGISLKKLREALKPTYEFWKKNK